MITAAYAGWVVLAVFLITAGGVAYGVVRNVRHTHRPERGPK